MDATVKKYIISAGHCQKLGATIEEDGVNFAIWSPDAAAIELLLFKSVDDNDPYIIKLSSAIFKSTYYWHVKVLGIKAGQIYAYRITQATEVTRGPICGVELNKILLDPYSKRILFPDNYQRFQKDNQDNFETCAKNVVIDMNNYNWGIDTLPHHSLENTVIYEMHVKGFTNSKTCDVAADIKGTYRGLIEKIPYLVDLGITTVELMPVYQFDIQDCREGTSNYWGYSPMGFFAPHEQYASDRSIMGPINEFRDMVKALHRHGIEVILDVVYNHTSEGDERGPTYSFKGFDKNGYYIIKDGYYQNFSGCGNTLNANEPVVRNLILDSLIFWHEEMHVDGFRFDLASILSRDKSGAPMNDGSTLLDIDINSRLAEAKIIAEPWDAGGLYQLGAISGTKWREWNGQFRDDIRSFLRSDPAMVKKFVLRLLGSPDIYNEQKVDPQKSINFITCHDGFTLCDLVSYASKHNEDNKEFNRDGSDNNYSANYGFEGPTDDKNLNKLRLRQIKNFIALTMLALGTPMLCMGDEVMRTQNGNNNAYCQDNELSYFNWEMTPEKEELLKFTKRMIALSKSQLKYNKGNAPEHKLNTALRNARIQWHGVKPFQPDWSDMSHSIGFTIYYPRRTVYAYVFVNAFWEDLKVELPVVPGKLSRQWYQVVNTADESGADIKEVYSDVHYNAGDIIDVKSLSVIMLFCPAT